MAAPQGNTNAQGNPGGGGKSLQDRKLAAKVRSLALEEVFRILTRGEDHKLYAPVLLKLSSSLLPRLNEHTGADGEKLIPIYNGQSIHRHESNTEDIQPEEENKSS